MYTLIYTHISVLAKNEAVLISIPRYTLFLATLYTCTHTCTHRYTYSTHAHTYTHACMGKHIHIWQEWKNKEPTT